MDLQLANYIAGETLLINKPKDWTSFDVVNKIRSTIRHTFSKDKKLKLKVGHAGTLDPLATGLLVVCTGKMTKSISSIQDAEKEYTGIIQFGANTASYDSETPVIETFDTSFLTFKLIKEKAVALVGKQQQMPPAYSALKIDGQPAYKIARKGGTPELKTREVEIRLFELSDFNEEQKTVRFQVVCSKGTYIRSLAFDLGVLLGTGAYLTELCRTRIGDLLLENGLELADFIEKLKKNDL